MTRLRWEALVPLVLAVTVFGLVGYKLLFKPDNEALPTVFIDKPAPPLPDTPLAEFALAQQSDLSGSGLKLVNFWASWCPPCRAEHPNLVRLQQDGWTIIGVNKSDEEANALGFLEELGNPYTSISTDPNGRGSIEWGVYGLPETFLIDGNGRIRYRHPGPVTQRVWEDRFAPIVEAIKTEN